MSELLMHFFPRNESFSFEAIRAAGYANFGCADIAEVISICSRIPNGDEDAWLKEWQAAADRAHDNARTSLAKGNKPCARDAFLRAANYYRAAEFYRRENPWEDEVCKKLGELSLDTFFAATDLMPHVTQRIRIPYMHTTLPGILMSPDSSDTPRPTIIINGGYDSTKEETIHSMAHLLELGFNLLSFDGPGQGQCLREQRLTFRHDWEAVLTPVMDYTLALPCVAKDKLVVIGISMGGYLVGRAAAFDHRAAAIVLNDGIYDFGMPFRAKTPPLGRFLITNGYDTTVKAIAGFLGSRDTGFKWGLANGKWVFGLPSEAGFLRTVEQYTLRDVAHQITTPTLVLDAPDDHFLQGQPQLIFDALKCDKDIVSLTREEGGSLHCHIGASGRLNQVVGDWLMDKLALAP